MTKPRWLTKQFQLMAALPLLIFLYRLWQYTDFGEPGWIMYNCHITTLMLAIAMAVGSAFFIRIASIWLVIGLPMWLIDAWVTQEIWIASITSHLGGFLLAMYAMKKVRATGWTWLPAWAWFLFWQYVTRLTTKPVLNVNISHTPYTACANWFSNYWSFWPVCAIVVGLMVVIVELLLFRLYPLEGRSAAVGETISIQNA